MFGFIFKNQSKEVILAASKKVLIEVDPSSVLKIGSVEPGTGQVIRLVQ